MESIAPENDEISFPQFLKYMANMKWEEMESRAKSHFMEFGEVDDDGEMGCVSEDGLKSLFRRLIKNVPERDIETLIAECDKEGTGQIGFEDFFRLLMGKLKEGAITKDTSGIFWWQQGESDSLKMQRLAEELQDLQATRDSLQREVDNLRRKYSTEVKEYVHEIEQLQEGEGKDHVGGPFAYFFPATLLEEKNELALQVAQLEKKILERV